MCYIFDPFSTFSMRELRCKKVIKYAARLRAHDLADVDDDDDDERDVLCWDSNNMCTHNHSIDPTRTFTLGMYMRLLRTAYASSHIRDRCAGETEKIRAPRTYTKSNTNSMSCFVRRINIFKYAQTLILSDTPHLLIPIAPKKKKNIVTISHR